MENKTRSVGNLNEVEINTINFQLLAEDAPVMLWLTDRNGEIIFTNNRYKNFIGREKVNNMGGGRPGSVPCILMISNTV